jgi:hemerythrin-like domain-containing protein
MADQLKLLTMEHDIIRRGLKAITRHRDNLQMGKPVSKDVFYTIIDFMSTYTDVVHHSKEERVLAPFLERQKVTSELSQIIIGCIDDHSQILQISGKLRCAARDYFADVPNARQRVIKYWSDYIDLVKTHSDTEDNKLFPKIRKLLSKEALDELAQELEAFDDKLPSDFHDHYAALVKKME